MRTNRTSTTSVDSNEMVYNEEYDSTSFSKKLRPVKQASHPLTENPLYAVAASDMSKAKAGAHLPPLPEEPEPEPGYAPIIPINKRGRSISSLPPSDPRCMPTPKRSWSEGKVTRGPPTAMNIGGDVRGASVIMNVGGAYLPALPEEPDAGYAPVMPVQMRARSVSSPPPEDYLKPVLSPQNTMERLVPPGPGETVFENRSSGIYEDPDYSPSPRRSASTNSKNMNVGGRGRSASASMNVGGRGRSASASMNVGGRGRSVGNVGGAPWRPVMNVGGVEAEFRGGGMNIGGEVAGEYEEPFLV